MIRVLMLFVALTLVWPLAAAEKTPPVRKPFGLEQRTPWTTSRVVGSPEPPLRYVTQPAFPKLKFNEPLEAVALPVRRNSVAESGPGRMLVAERKGQIYSFLDSSAAATKELAYEFVGKTEDGKPLPQIVYAMAAHPQFADNGFVYVTYIPDPRKDNVPNGTRVSRFRVSGDPPKFDPASEKKIIEWHNGGHNGGALAFGNDGMLYIATGDASGIADERQTGQDISDLFGSLLRIDVDSAGADQGYVVPKDNPFVGGKVVRPEIWAYGLRQVWRFSFDRADGQLWAGEVGQDLWEMVYAIKRGGNYGWSITEGSHPFRPERKLGPSPILKPVVEHSHSDFRSITGGYVYGGKRLPELQGHYIYGDFDTGRIWSFKPQRSGISQEFSVIDHGELARTTHRIVAFCKDHEGEILLIDFMGGGLHRLASAPDLAKTPPPFPKKLSETGIFQSVKDHQVAPGVIPYSVNAELWSDHAVKQRFIAIPGNGQVGFDQNVYPEGPPGAPAGWKFPDGTVLVKSFFMDMERGNPASRKRLETRLLHFQQFPGSNEVGDQYWRGYTYVWNDEQTDAELLDGAGLDKTLRIKDGDQTIEQTYHFPSRAECALCHNNAAKFALGVSTLQMNRDHDYGGVLANQLATLDHIGLFDKPLPKKPEELPQLANYDDANQSIDIRARAYLHSNCAHCHTKWGGGNAEFKLTSTLPLDQLGITGMKPGHGSFGIKDAALIAPGHPEQSVILHRMNLTALGRMPHIGSKTVHQSAVKLVEEWIKQLPAGVK
ncbi:PQQ-dependent sugar dehydrogenase [Anatilimnocola floriformis]|uniref:PQQ-dependent sugar dehydrogenase n=1 Tax=Anatilimnocola floriformis TaxID=2948575 RepID=UPI0020C3156A|nr:PQQ-dependent sugar dehydrogenase [Anatilimnocola floriformis]